MIIVCFIEEFFLYSMQKNKYIKTKKGFVKFSFCSYMK